MGAKDDRDRDTPAPAGDCPLSAREQTRNVILYGVNASLIYLASSTLYVGSVQAALFEKLGKTKTLSNLPITLYFWTMPLPIVVAWYFCSVRHLKRVLIVTYLLTGTSWQLHLLTYGYLPSPTPSQVHLFSALSNAMLIVVALLGVLSLFVIWRRNPDMREAGRTPLRRAPIGPGLAG